MMCAFGTADGARCTLNDGSVAEAIDVLVGAAGVMDVVVRIGVGDVAVAKVFSGIRLANLMTLIHASHRIWIRCTDRSLC